ncbi:MAG: DUF5711 family protein [Clostridia bacterium]|nr:DUF5711 family protein [Clostridia bacterium]
MNQINEKKNIRQKENNPAKNKKNHIILIAVLSLLTLSLIIIAAVRTSSVENKFPYSTGGYDSLQKMDMLGNDLFLLTNDESIVLSPSGNEIQKIKHSFSNPLAVVNKNKALVYDLNGSSFYAQNSKNQIFSGKIEDKIITADIDGNSNVALATSSKDSLMKLSVYKKSFTKKAFEWMTYSSVIVGTSLSGNDTVAVALYETKNYKSIGKVLIFDFSKTKPIAEFEFPGSSILAVKYTSPDNLIVVTDNKLIGIKNNKKISNEYKYGELFLRGFSFNPSRGGNILLSAGENSNKNNLVSFNGKGKIISEKSADQNVESIYSTSSKIYVLTKDSLFTYSSVGKPKSTQLEVSATEVVGNNYNTYIYSYGKIYKIKR